MPVMPSSRKRATGHPSHLMPQTVKRIKLPPERKRQGPGKPQQTMLPSVPLIKMTMSFGYLSILGREPNTFYVTPLSWIRNDIYTAYMVYLEKHGGHRAQNDESTHHSISVKRIADWKDAWGLMGCSPFTTGNVK
ncbi:hypothetical protein ACSPAH_15625 [Buttiauxella agrestis]